MLSSGMAQENTDSDRARATESEVYLPAEVITAFNPSRFRRIWTTLFGHCAGPPK
jgi:hypothetical protein